MTRYRLRRWLGPLVFALVVGASFTPALAAATAVQPQEQPVRSVPMQLVANCSSKPHPLGLEPWYQFLKEYKDADGECAVCFNVTNAPNFDTTDCPGSKTSSIPLILLAIVDDLLRIGGLIAIGYVIFGAIQYTTSQGSPDAVSKAQNTVINALIGLAIASIAVAFVSFVGNRLGG